MIKQLINEHNLGVKMTSVYNTYYNSAITTGYANKTDAVQLKKQDIIAQILSFLENIKDNNCNIQSKCIDLITSTEAVDPQICSNPQHKLFQLTLGQPMNLNGASLKKLVEDNIKAQLKTAEAKSIKEKDMVTAVNMFTELKLLNANDSISDIYTKIKGFKDASVDSIITVQQILMIVKQFFNVLLNTYKVNINIFFKRNNFYSKLCSAGVEMYTIDSYGGEIGCWEDKRESGRYITKASPAFTFWDKHDDGRTRVVYTHYDSFIVSPEAVQYNRSKYDLRWNKSNLINQQSNSFPTGTMLLTQNLDGINTNSQLFDFSSDEGTNGQLKYNYELLYEKNKLAEYSINDLFDMFNIVKGNIIDYANVINLINFIYFTWLYSISCLTTNIYMCHYNCHTNGFTKITASDAPYVVSEQYEGVENLDELYAAYNIIYSDSSIASEAGWPSSLTYEQVQAGFTFWIYNKDTEDQTNYTFTKTAYRVTPTTINLDSSWVADGSNKKINVTVSVASSATISTGVAITFDANGGSVSPTSKSVRIGTTYGELPTPTYDGHTFNGWFSAATDGTSITSSTTINASSPKTIYAQWTEDSPPEEPEELEET